MTASPLLAGVRNRLRTQLWPLPAVGIAAAVLLGVGLPQVDRAVDEALPAVVTSYLFGGGSTSARAVLQAISGSLISVTALTFSLTVVTLQLASSQFSPRLLRTFARDRVVHATLALFLSTFTYALSVLRTVRDAADRQPQFVPQISVTLAFLLAVASVLCLVLFLAHLAREIRVETMLRTVHAEASSTARQLLADRVPTATPPALPVPPPTAVRLLAGSSGFLVGLDERLLVAAAEAADAVVVVAYPVGSSLVAQTPFGATWRRNGAPFAEAVLVRLRREVDAAVATGFERTEEQDIGYGLRQLTDVASKALSPGVNDPTTAVHALGHAAALLCELAGLELGPQVLYDEEHVVRVAITRPELADLLDLALSQPRRYGRGDPLVLGRLFVLLRELGWVVTDPAQRRAVAQQLDRLRATVREQAFDPAEVRQLDAQAELVVQALDGHWPVTLLS
ncbi:MAG: DUF2254 domain-containing protein [Actinomycetota bacterium]|nr:DUF2254 domain-containing protein [Actinomycetota bacterium]